MSLVPGANTALPAERWKRPTDVQPVMLCGGDTQLHCACCDFILGVNVNPSDWREHVLCPRCNATNFLP